MINNPIDMNYVVGDEQIQQNQQQQQEEEQQQQQIMGSFSDPQLEMDQQQQPQLIAPVPVSPHHMQQMMAPVSPQQQPQQIVPSVSPHLMQMQQQQIIPSVSPHLIQMEQQQPQQIIPSVSPHIIQMEQQIIPSVSPHLMQMEQQQPQQIIPSVSPHLMQMEQQQQQIIPSVSPHLMQMEQQQSQQIIPSVSPHLIQMEQQQPQQIIPSVSPHIIQMEQQQQQIIPSVSPHIIQMEQQPPNSVSPHPVQPQQQLQLQGQEEQEQQQQQINPDEQSMQEYSTEEMQQAQAEQELLDLQSMQLDGLKKISFQRFVPCNPDNYIITNHSMLKRKTLLANGINARKINSALVLAEPPTPNDIARELMPKAKIAKLASEASDSTKALLKAFEAGNFKIEPPENEPSVENTTPVAEWDDELEEEREKARDEGHIARQYEIPQTKEQQKVEHILRENSYFLYNLQVSQYQRLSGVISKTENSYATKLARNITDLGIAIPTSVIANQSDVGRALRESDLVNDLVPTTGGSSAEPPNENKGDKNENDAKE